MSYTDEELKTLNAARTLIQARTQPHREIGIDDGNSQTRWMNTTDVEGRPYTGNRTRKIVDPVTGEERIEKQPSLGHTLDTDYLERKHGKPWVELILRPDGNVVFQAMTNSSARARGTGKYVLDRYTIWALEKRTALGWIPMNACPVDLIASEDLQAKHLLVNIAGSPACAKGSYDDEHPCPHVVAERAARTAKYSAEQARIADASRSKEELGQVAMAQTIAQAVRESLEPKRKTRGE